MSETSSAGTGILARSFWVVAAVIWTAAVLALALTPKVENIWLMKTFGDKLMHGAAFTVGAVVWVRTLQLFPRLSKVSGIVAGSVVALLIGVAIEICQRYIPGRTADIRDFASDIAGVLLAVALLSVWGLRKPRPRT